MELLFIRDLLYISWRPSSAFTIDKGVIQLWRLSIEWN
jgi:hypothetical protein